MILKIQCSNCSQDLVNYKDDLTGNLQLYCIPCGSEKFSAFHVEETKHTVHAIKQGLMRLKNVDFKDFDSVLETVSDDFNSLLLHL